MPTHTHSRSLRALLKPVMSKYVAAASAAQRTNGLKNNIVASYIDRVLVCWLFRYRDILHGCQYANELLERVSSNNSAAIRTNEQYKVHRQCFITHNRDAYNAVRRLFIRP